MIDNQLNGALQKRIDYSDATATAKSKPVTKAARTFTYSINTIILLIIIDMTQG